MRGLLALGLGMLLVAGLAEGGDAKTDAAKLQGKWVGEVKGMKIELTLAKDKFTFDFGGKAFKGTVKIDSKKKPKELDMTITEGEVHVNDTALGIYEVMGDTLKWCASQPGSKDRPKEFPAGDGSPTHLNVTFKRAK